MAKAKRVVQIGNPVLNEKTIEVDVSKIQSEETKKIIADMFLTLEDHKETGAGLSANQIGYSVRIAICRRMDLEDRRKDKKELEPIWEVMINPQITKKSKEMSTEWEGCLSINFGDLFGQVTRPSVITVEYFDEKGNKKELEAAGYFSHVVQHEVDHLDGILFTKYVKDPTHLYTTEELASRD